MRNYLQVSSDLVLERVGAFAENEDAGLLVEGDSYPAPCAVLCSIFFGTHHRPQDVFYGS